MNCFTKISAKTRATDGSAIVGVLAALVFIAIVVSFMVKNTGAQSANAIGYASALTMQSTARSGIVATEGFFLNGGAAGADFLDAVDKSGTAGGPESFLFNSANARARLTAGQFFSSRLKYYDNKLNIGQPYINAGFEVSAGKNASGKEMKKAWAFYRLENLTQGNPGGYAPKNLFYSESPVMADAGMDVGGGAATFKDAVIFNGNNLDLLFDGSVYFHDKVTVPSGIKKFQFDSTVYFNGAADIQSEVAFKNWAFFSAAASVNKGVFEDKVYFGGLADFLNGPITFKGAVGFAGNIRTNLTVNTEKNVYINGNFDYNGKFDGDVGVDDTLYRTSQFTAANRYQNFSDSINTGVTPINILQKLNINTAGMTLNERRDPELDITKIPASIRNKYTHLDIGGHNGAANQLSMNKLKQLYQSADPSDLYMGYLVISVRGDLNTNHLTVNDVFDGKVIFIIENGGKLASNGSFYNSGANSSTLIYVNAGNGQLDQFGTEGDFRGLIYIDKDNTANNSFNFTKQTPGQKIYGAIHNFASKQIIWNVGHQVPIAPCPEALNDFGSLIKDPPAGGIAGGGPGSSGSGSGISLIDGKEYVKPVPLGYYFH